MATDDSDPENYELIRQEESDLSTDQLPKRSLFFPDAFDDHVEPSN